MELFDKVDKPRCPRCSRSITGKGEVVQGVLFGPTCCTIVYRRARLREGYGESPKELRRCEVSGKEFYSRAESEAFCPPVVCAVCRYNTRQLHHVTLCPLEVAAKQREVDKWK